MTSVVVGATNVASFPEGGGHFWVFMQYVLGLRAAGCRVSWLERVPANRRSDQTRRSIALFLRRLAAFEFAGDVLLYESAPSGDVTLLHGPAAGWRVLEQADLLVNFDYSIAQSVRARSPRAVLVDIDPGLLQFWVREGQIALLPHDRYLTIGETVGTPGSLIPDVGLQWHWIRPPVSLADWPVSYDPAARAFTTVSSWWGGHGKGEWVTDGRSKLYENNKRVSFLQFAELPLHAGAALELALDMGTGDPEPGMQVWGPDRLESPHEGAAQDVAAANATDYVTDADDRRALERHGWRIVSSRKVAGTPQAYRAYIQGSRGEFSCVKPSCVAFQNAWISDRSLCYLASGKPVVIQDTGPSRFLPNGEGLIRFATFAEAVSAIEQIQSHYPRHCSAAREIAEAWFDAESIALDILEVAL